MRFTNISIKNMRLIGETPMKIDLSTDKNVVILLGDNGFGKTTILDALATAMAPYSAQFPGISDFQLKDWDVHLNNEGKIAPYLTVEAELLDNGTQISSTRYRKGSSNPPKANYELLKEAAITRKNAIISGNNDIILPVFAYYGTGRGQFEVPKRNRGFQQAYERWDCYKSAIQPETDFKRFFGWLDLAEDDERRTRDKLKDYSYKSPVLEAVRKALSKIVTNYHNPRIETKPLRFVMDSVNPDGSHHELRIEQMSDGYKIVISMVADLAARMAEANPNISDPLKTPGIVLIDEIDLHLHPHWQRNILYQLTQVFENIQFIVTTHSPVIAIGASGFAQIVNLNTKDTITEDISMSNVGSVLLSDLFGLKSLQSPIWDEKIKERDNILSKPHLEKEDEVRLTELDKELKGLTILQDSNAIRAEKILEEIATQLNLKI